MIRRRGCIKCLFVRKGREDRRVEGETGGEERRGRGKKAFDHPERNYQLNAHGSCAPAPQSIMGKGSGWLRVQYTDSN